MIHQQLVKLERKKNVKHAIIIQKFKNQCESCNEGYYLSEDGNKTICENCDIEGCLICSGTKKNKIYNLCAKNYILNNNEFIEEECDLGEHERCESCRTEKGRKKECLTCNSGYYLPYNEINNKICLSCNFINIVLHALEKKIIFYVQNVNMDLYYIIMSVKKKNA